MIKFLLIVVALADLALAALLIGVSGFTVGGGPESMRGGSLLAAGYVAAILACIALPIASFIVNRRGKSGLGLALAFVPIVGGLATLMIPAPY